MMLHQRDRSFVWSASSAVIAVVVGLAPLARAEEPVVGISASVALSERRAADAFQAYAKEDYALAVALYLDAYDAAPSASILYNIARVYDTKLGNHPQAINFYRRYIAAPGTRVELVQIANQRLRELHEVELTPSTSMEEGSTPVDETMRRERASSSPSMVDPNHGRGNGWSRLRWVSVALGAVGVVGVGVGTGFGLAALSQARTANELCNGNACESQRGVDAANAASKNATVSTIGFGTGIALLTAAVALFFVGAEKPTQPSSPRSPNSHVRLGLETRPVASGFSLQVTGKW